MDLLQQLYLYCILYTYSHCILHTFVVHTRFMLILRWGSYCGAAGMGGGGGERALEEGGTCVAAEIINYKVVYMVVYSKNKR